MRRDDRRLLRALAGLAAAAALGWPAPAEALSSWHVGVRGGTLDLSGSAYDAVYGETPTALGVQAEARFRNESFFVRLAADRGEADGELVAPRPGGGTFRTGEPTEITVTPVHLSLGLVDPGRMGLSSWGYYVGGGLTWLDQEEDNRIEASSGSGTGLHGVLGIRWTFGGPEGRAAVGAEALWFSASDVFEGGLAELLDDRDLDGLSLTGLVTFRLGG